MSAEVWRPVPGYEEIYSVSDQGRVRRDAGGRGSTAGRILTSKRASNGYRHVDLSRGDSKERWLVHRLVAWAFLGPPPGSKHEINHRDANKSNNAPDNLEWVTPQENVAHAMALKLRTPPDQSGEKNSRAKLTAVQVEEIRALKGKVSQRRLAERFEVARTTIQWIHNGRNWATAEWPADLQVREWPEVLRGC